MLSERHPFDICGERRMNGTDASHDGNKWEWELADSFDGCQHFLNGHHSQLRYYFYSRQCLWFIMKSVSSLFSLLLCLLLASSNAFAPKAFLTTKTATKATPLFGFLGEPERKKLTRDSEPEEFFATWVFLWFTTIILHRCFLTFWHIAFIVPFHHYFYRNTDKMTDKEKLPIALIGVAAICVPFIAGLIALYASK